MSRRKITKPVDSTKKLSEDSASIVALTMVSQDCSLKVEETEWLTSDEAAEYLRVSTGTLRNMTSNGRIPYVKLGRSNRYNRHELQQLLFSARRGVRDGH